MRTIIRFSLNDDHGSKLRNVLSPILTGVGMTRVSTGTYNGDVDEAQLRVALGQFWNQMAGYAGAAHLDHFWMYTDNVPQEE